MSGQLFDAHAADYDGWYTTPMGSLVDRLEKEAVLGFLKPRPGLSVLDVGCGTGTYALELAAAGLKVSGVDISPAMLDLAREKAGASDLGISFHLADACNLPFEENTFDAVVSVTALEFIPEPGAALAEAYRVLKPGGTLVVGVIEKNSAWGRYYSERARSRPESVFRRARLYTAKELVELLPGRGIKVRGALFVPPDFDFANKEEACELERAAQRAGRTDGGFLCAVSVKALK